MAAKLRLFGSLSALSLHSKADGQPLHLQETIKLDLTGLECSPSDGC